MKSREVELGCHSWMDCLAAELFLDSCFSDTVTLLRTAVETAMNEVHKLFLTGGVLTLTLFWRWLAVSSVFVGWIAGRATHGYPNPLTPSLISLTVSVDVKHHERRIISGPQSSGAVLKWRWPSWAPRP